MAAVTRAGVLMIAPLHEALGAVAAARDTAYPARAVAGICAVAGATRLQQQLDLLALRHAGDALYASCAPPPIVGRDGAPCCSERVLEEKLTCTLVLMNSIGAPGASLEACAREFARPLHVRVRFLPGGARRVEEAPAEALVDAVRMACEHGAAGDSLVLLGAEDDASDALLLAIAVHAAAVHAAALAEPGAWRPRVASEPRHLEAVVRVATAFMQGRYARGAAPSRWFHERRAASAVPAPPRELRLALGAAMCSDAWTSLVQRDPALFSWLWAHYDGATARVAAESLFFAARPGVPAAAVEAPPAPDEEEYDPAFPAGRAGVREKRARLCAPGVRGW